MTDNMVTLDDLREMKSVSTMYESPIKVVMDRMRTSFDENVVRAVQHYDIDVDREELIKALQYDRGQYEKGFNDGYKQGIDDAIKLIRETLTRKFDEDILGGLKCRK